MIKAAHEAMQFVDRRDRADLDREPLLCRALTHALLEIGEAAARVSDDGRARAPEVPWGQIVAMRHVLVHVYWGVDRDRLWKTATEELPILVAQLEDALQAWPAPDPSP